TRVDVIDRIRVRTIQVLMYGSGRNADSRGGSDIGDLVFVIAIAIENLNAFVARIGCVDVAFCIDRNSVHSAELAVGRAARTPGSYELAVFIEFRDAGIAKPIGHVNISGRVPRDIGWPIEEI